jgi:hypothetical protein
VLLSIIWAEGVVMYNTFEFLHQGLLLLLAPSDIPAAIPEVLDGRYILEVTILRKKNKTLKHFHFNRAVMGTK